MTFFPSITSFLGITKDTHLGEIWPVIMSDIALNESSILSTPTTVLFSILRSGYFYLDSYHEEHPRVFATNIRYRIMSLAWMETYGVS